ncbi:PREDICTED: uncharacterized protein C8orf74 homolog [Gekko japonicus]|uniref:Uncharacterized protein C8orf74 homolog n=1 Tax=Gekko japonicus TaxID=146911 RepID=A0ABM1JPL1_GEKJA|nr:PREDICTED: uncharacterized protein C8orf74 homolog [Gekko japonicus]
MASLSAEGVETVIKLQRKLGRQYLRVLLEWKEFDEIRDLRRSIQLDTIYHSLVFAAEKGLPWLAVAEVGKLTVELLDETKGLPISQAIQILQEKLTAFRVRLPVVKLRAVCDYFHNTFIKHYWLYQFTLEQERDRCQTFTSLELYAPPTPLPLMEGMDVEVWKYQQQLAALSEMEAQKRAEMVLIRETLDREKERTLQKVYSDVQRQARVLSKEALMCLVSEAIKTQIQSLCEILQSEIQTTFDILQLKLQKKSLLLNPPVPYPPPPTPEDKRRSSKNPKKQEKTKEREGDFYLHKFWAWQPRKIATCFFDFKEMIAQGNTVIRSWATFQGHPGKVM